MWVSRKRKMMWISLVRKSREEPTQKWVGTGGAAAGIQNWHRPCFAFIAAHADVVISTLFFLSLFFPFSILLTFFDLFLKPSHGHLFPFTPIWNLEFGIFLLPFSLSLQMGFVVFGSHLHLHFPFLSPL